MITRPPSRLPSVVAVSLALGLLWAPSALRAAGDARPGLAGAVAAPSGLDAGLRDAQAQGLPPPASQSAPPPPRPRPAPARDSVPSQTGATATPFPPDLAGPYLAARQALRMNDFLAGRVHFLNAVRADPDNPAVRDWALGALIGAGDFDAALTQAQALRSLDPQNPQARLVRVAAALRALSSAGSDPSAAMAADLAADLGDGQIAGPVPDRLVRGWVALASGDLPGAVDRFRSVARMPGVAAAGQYSLALALAVSGDPASAEAVLADAADSPGLTRRAALLRVQLLSGLGRPQQALEVLLGAFDVDADPALARIASSLGAAVALPQDIARTPAEGAAEVFHLLALALREDAPDQQSLFYARLAQALNPSNHDATLLVADLLQDLDQTALAAAAYASVPDSAIGSLDARTGRARMLHAQGETEAALAELARLAADHPSRPAVHVAQADMLRREERFAEAALAYSRAIALIDDPQPRHWVLFYSRGIAHERARNWDAAEPDFRRALRLSPDQPFVLNYLGYSFLEQGRNLDEAMAMIQRAVAQEPDSGYIVDSLGWGYFMLGRYAEAVAPMERAVTLMPLDPIVTDHLGDVYWAVGRQREARFQWQRALSFNPEAELAQRIRRKLAEGLDAVLAAEGAPPLTLPRR